MLVNILLDKDGWHESAATATNTFFYAPLSFILLNRAESICLFMLRWPY